MISARGCKVCGRNPNWRNRSCRACEERQLLQNTTSLSKGIRFGIVIAFMQHSNIFQLDFVHLRPDILTQDMTEQHQPTQIYNA